MRRQDRWNSRLPGSSTLTLIGICVGAFIAQVGPLHGDVVHVFVLGGLLALVAWLTRPASLRRA